MSKEMCRESTHSPVSEKALSGGGEAPVNEGLGENTELKGNSLHTSMRKERVSTWS